MRRRTAEEAHEEADNKADDDAPPPQDPAPQDPPPPQQRNSRISEGNGVNDQDQDFQRQLTLVQEEKAEDHKLTTLCAFWSLKF